MPGSRWDELIGDNYASGNSDRDNASLNSATEVYTAVKCAVQYNQYIPELDGAIMFQSGGDQLYLSIHLWSSDCRAVLLHNS